MTKTIEEIQKRLLELATERKAEEARARREQLHIELQQQFTGEDNPADFYKSLLD